MATKDIWRVWGQESGEVRIRNEGGKGVVYADQIVISDVSGDGIKVGDVASSAYGWRDITGRIEVRGVAATDPDWAQIASTGFYAYDFSVNDTVWISYHIPHDFVPGTDVHFHVHWMPDGTDANIVKWQFQVAYAKGFDQEAFPLASPTTLTCQEAGPGVAYQHMVTETAAVDLGITEPDGHILAIIKRLTNGGTENTDEIFVFDADVHYQSTNMATVGKAPSFYG